MNPLYFILGAMLALTVCILYSALVVASRCDDQEDEEEREILAARKGEE